MTTNTYDRRREDVGNIIAFEHVNVTVPDLTVATWFYVNALGFTRDPYVDLGPDLIWINLGRQQFHLPVGDPQVVRGTMELVVPSLAMLQTRLDSMTDHLAGTEFGFAAGADAVEVTGPWGNRFHCVESPRTDAMQVGMRALVFPVAAGSAEGIARFYQQVIGAPATVAEGRCTVNVGPGQAIHFDETTSEVAPYDGHHLAVYVSDFSTPHRWLVERDLIMEETDQHQYRFKWIVDPDSGDRLFEIEHEVRSLGHRLYQRPLINRNPDQNLRNYVPGRDPFQPRTHTDDDSHAAVQEILTTAG